MLGRSGANRVELYGPTGLPLRTRDNTKLDVASTEIEAALADIQDRIGAVGADPAANTLLARLKDLLTELQAQEYGTSQPITAMLAPNTDTLFTMAAECAQFDLINEGPGDVYVKVDAVAGIGGAGCLKLPEAMAYPLRQRGTVVHVIGAAASVVQIVGVR